MTSIATAVVLLFSSALINTKPSPVFAEVTVGGQGPYRFMVDTGSQSTLLDEKLAGQLGLKPEFRVEVLTQHTTRLLPALKMRTLRIGEHALAETEVVFQDLGEARRLYPKVKGILGMDALAGLDFALSPAEGKMDVNVERPSGDAVPLFRKEGRIAIQARMGREDLTLILDSGASHVLLFRTPEAMAKIKPVEATLGTLDGARSVVPTCWTADMTFTRSVKVGMLPAAIVKRPGTEVDGLMPASAFKRIYVDQSRGEVVLVR
jgi:hypothetical protein